VPDLDPAAVKAAHTGLHTCSALVWHPEREGRNGLPCLPYRLAESLAAVSEQRDQWRNTARRDWVDEVSARTMQLKDEISALRERAEDAEAQLERTAEPYRVQPPSSSLRPMRGTCACGTSPDPGVCYGCSRSAQSHCMCAHPHMQRKAADPRYAAGTDPDSAHLEATVAALADQPEQAKDGTPEAPCQMQAELAGGGAHDGATVALPEGCVALVLVSADADGDYVASLGVLRGAAVVRPALAECLAALAVSPQLGES